MACHFSPHHRVADAMLCSQLRQRNAPAHLKGHLRLELGDVRLPCHLHSRANPSSRERLNNLSEFPAPSRNSATGSGNRKRPYCSFLNSNAKACGR